MAKRDTVRAGAARALAADGYFSRSQRPLEILLFLLPLIALYEVGLVLLLRSGGTVRTNKAHEAIVRVFEVFGLDGGRLSLPALCLPGIMLVAILLAWQVLARKPWTVSLRTIGFMAVESMAWAIPLFLAVQLVALAFPHAAPVLAATASDGLRDLSPMGLIAIAIGAGLYEELVFRMALIAVLHTMFVDALHWTERNAIAVSVTVAAIAFVLYHPLRDERNLIEWQRVAALTILGLSFGAIYARRGFGIVVGAHAAYDIAALLLQWARFHGENVTS